MSSATLEFGIEQHKAEYLYDEIARPTGRDKGATGEFVDILRKHLGILEELVRKQAEPIDGFSIEEAQRIARNLLRTVELYGRLLDTIESSPYGPENPVGDMRARLVPLNKKAQALSRISNLPVPVFNEERMQRGYAEIERGGGVDAEELLSRLTQEGA